MIKNYLIYLISGLLLFFSIGASALSFGEIKVNSHFAQPFSAEINVPSYTEDEIDNISIQLADKSEFARRGLEYHSILKNFQFKLENRSNGSLYIHVTSKLAVKELSVSLLVEVTWPSGRIIKQYDILLTPEAITELWQKNPRQQQTIGINTQPKTINLVTPDSGVVTQNTTRSQASAGVVDFNTTTTPKTTQSGDASNNEIKKLADGSLRYESVKPGDSLSFLAQAFRPESNMSMQQVMVALFNQNRNAFLNDNINRLQSGVPLILKDFDKIWDLSRREAIAFIERVSGDHSSNAAKNVLSASITSGTNTSDVFQDTPHLQIAQVDEDIIPAEIMQKLKMDEIKQKSNQLQQTQSEARQIQLQNEALKKRIAELEAKIDRSAENLFLNTVDPETSNEIQDSLSQQQDNLLVTESNLALAETTTPQTQSSDDNYTPLAIAGIIVLIFVMIGLRKKEQILELVRKNKNNKNDKDNTFSFH